MKCLRCGSETVEKTGGAEIIMECPECGWKAVTTCMSEIEDDLTRYSITIEKGNLVDKELIKLVSGISGKNTLEARKLLMEGGLMVREYAIVIKKIIAELDMAGIEYQIDPQFPY